MYTFQCAFSTKVSYVKATAIGILVSVFFIFPPSNVKADSFLRGEKTSEVVRSSNMPFNYSFCKYPSRINVFGFLKPSNFLSKGGIEFCTSITSTSSVLDIASQDAGEQYTDKDRE